MNRTLQTVLLLKSSMIWLLICLRFRYQVTGWTPSGLHSCPTWTWSYWQLATGSITRMWVHPWGDVLCWLNSSTPRLSTTSHWTSSRSICQQLSTGFLDQTQKSRPIVSQCHTPHLSMICHPHVLHWLCHPDARRRGQSYHGSIWLSDISNCAICFQLGLPPVSTYKRALHAVRHYFDVTPFRGLPIFVTFSPSHKDQVCPSKRPFTNLMLALNYTTGYEASDMKISLEEFRGSKFKIAQVTYLSALRPDAHRGREKHDCSHWCLPGVPDSWSSIVYNYIMKSSMFFAGMN